MATERDMISTAKTSETMQAAVKRLKNRHVQSLPVLDEKDRVVGVLDMCDSLSFLAASAVGTADVRQLTVETVMQSSARDVFVPCQAGDSGVELLNLFASGIHRVPVVDLEQKLIGVVSQMDVAKLVVGALESSDAGAAMAAEHIGGRGGNEPIVCLESDTVQAVVEQLDNLQVHAVGVVDAHGKLVGNFSVSNLVHLFEQPHELALSVREFLAKHEPGSLTPLTAKPNDSLLSVVRTLVAHHVHRVFVVDEATAKPLSVFTLTDLAKIVRVHGDETHKKAAGAAAAPHAGSSVVLRTPNGRVVASENKQLVLKATADGAHIRVELVEQDVRGGRAIVMLRTADGQLIAVDEHQRVVLQAHEAPNAHWQEWHGDTGMVAFRSVATGGFLEHAVGGDALHAHQLRLSHKAARPTKKQMFKKSSK